MGSPSAGFLLSETRHMATLISPDFHFYLKLMETDIEILRKMFVYGNNFLLIFSSNLALFKWIYGIRSRNKLYWMKHM